MVDSPAYRLNHEEVIKALEEGITFTENINPIEAIPDERGALKAVIFKRESKDLPAGQDPTDHAAGADDAGRGGNDAEHHVRKGVQGDVPARCEEEVLPAARRDRRTADGKFHLQSDANGFFTSYEHDGKFVTYYGDNHPRYAGNVVKAMASAKDGFPHIVKLFAKELATLDPAAQPAARCRVGAAVQAARHRARGRGRGRRPADADDRGSHRQGARGRAAFPSRTVYRLQNYESVTPPGQRTGGARAVPLLMEGIALTGAWVDKERGLLSLIALELGVSSRLCAYLKKGEPVVVMGPTGTPTEIPKSQNVLLLGGGLGNAVLFSIAKAMRDAGNRVIYFAGYKKGEDLFKREEIEAATDQVIWSTDTGAAIPPGRPQDAHFRGNIVQAMLAYNSGELGKQLVPLPTVDRIIAIGSDRMMAAVKAARHGVLEPYLKKEHVGIGSINSPMQCMMKEVCAQCLQKHVDPATGKEEIIFSCFNQDQELDRVDFPNLAARLRQNTVQEKLASMWLDHLLQGQNLPHV